MNKLSWINHVFYSKIVLRNDCLYCYYKESQINKGHNNHHEGSQFCCRIVHYRHYVVWIWFFKHIYGKFVWSHCHPKRIYNLGIFTINRQTCICICIWSIQYSECVLSVCWYFCKIISWTSCRKSLHKSLGIMALSQQRYFEIRSSIICCWKRCLKYNSSISSVNPSSSYI